MFALRKGRYGVRFAATQEDLIAAQRLRYLAFVRARGLHHGGVDAHSLDKHNLEPDTSDARDVDRFDAICRHVLIEDRKTGQLLCTFRFLELSDGADISRSYAAQYYGLEALEGFKGRMLEMGRFCVHPELRDPDVLRVAWGAMTAYVDDHGIDLLFGCSSFEGTDWADHADALAMLKHRHIGPKRFLPRVKAPNVFKFAARLRRKPNAKRAALKMPPLLKTYLMMGGWVSDHAVVDRQLGTMHVFTGVEINAIPPARKKLLRAVVS